MPVGSWLPGGILSVFDLQFYKEALCCFEQEL